MAWTEAIVSGMRGFRASQVHGQLNEQSSAVARLLRKPREIRLPTNGGRNERNFVRNEITVPVAGHFAAFSHALFQGALMHLISEWFVRQPLAKRGLLGRRSESVHPAICGQVPSAHA